MRVLKFGGTSVGSAERMEKVAQIITGNENPQIVVLSAMSGTTNALVEINSYLSLNDFKRSLELVRQLREKYLDVIQELYKTKQFKIKASAFIDEKFDFLESLTQKPFSIQNEKIILAQGELISTELFQYYLEEKQVKSVLLPALSFMRLDRLSEPDIFYIKENLERELKKFPDIKIFITQGYISLNSWGEVDNLQRGGSDYTATLIGAAIKAEDVQIWTDIDGLHNNDPRVVKDTKPVPELSYSEAEELAYFGAKILHPLCIIPAHQYNIPVWLKNTMDPKAYGTHISDKKSSSQVKAIAAKDGITAINIQSARMIMAYGFLRKVFEIFERYQTSIDMITTSEVAVSLTIDNDSNLSRILQELRLLGNVTCEKNQVIIAIVGNDISQSHQVADIFSALKNIPVRMISYGGSNNNVSLLVDKQNKDNLLESLSKALF